MKPIRQRALAHIVATLLILLWTLPATAKPARSYAGHQAWGRMGPEPLLFSAQSATAPTRGSETAPLPASGHEGTTSQLLDALLTLMDRDQPVDTRVHAALTLGTLQDTRVIVPLLYALADPEPRIQLAVIQALGHYTDLVVEKALATVLQDPDRSQTVRAAAAGSLGAQRTVSARTVLYTVFRGAKQPQVVRQACSDALEANFPGYLASLGESGRAVDRRGRGLLIPASCLFGSYALGTIGQYGRSEAAQPIGFLSGLVLGGAGAFLLTQNTEMTMAQAGSIVSGGGWGLWTGITVGRMATYDNPDAETVTTLGLAGEALGLTATALTLRRNPFSFGDIVTINLAGTMGHNALWGLLLLSNEPANTPGALGGLAGFSLASMAGSAAITRRLHFTESDTDLIVHGALEGAWLGAWAPRLQKGDVDADQTWGGILLGSSLGTLATGAISQYTELEASDPLFFTAMSGYGNLLGAGIPMLSGADDRRLVVGTMLGLSLVGEASGILLRNQVVFNQGDAALTGLGTAWGAWQGFSLGAYLYSRPNAQMTISQMTGAGLTGTALGGLGTMVVGQHTDVSSWEVLMLASGGMWGSWFSFWGNTLADSSNDTIWLSNLIASNAALASTAILMSPAVNVHPTRVGIADLAGMSGAALASLGAALATDDSDTIITANLIGSSVGLVAGAIVASRVKVVHEPQVSGRWRRIFRSAARWHPQISVVPLPPSPGAPSTIPGWYATLSARQPLPR